MELCIQSKIAVLLCIISLMFGISINGLSLGMVFIELIVDIIFISVVNWLCFKEGFNTIAWILVVISAIVLFLSIILVRMYGKDLEKIPSSTPSSTPSSSTTPSSTMLPSIPTPSVSSLRDLVLRSVTTPL